MAEILLQNILSSRVSVSDTIDWLTARTSDNNVVCRRDEFVAYFLNYLRDQFTDILQIDDVRQTPEKKNTNFKPKTMKNQSLIEEPGSTFNNSDQQTSTPLNKNVTNCKYNQLEILDISCPTCPGDSNLLDSSKKQKSLELSPFGSPFRRDVSNRFNSTPERSFSKTSSSIKSTPKNTLCLGDFINVSQTSSKKSSGKKNSSKSFGDISTSSPNTKKIQPRRRINPTKLSVDNAGDDFGTITRPSIINPHFMQASPITDKSHDNISFNAERELLKKERQNNDFESPTKFKLLPKTPSKCTQPGLVIVPEKDLVEDSLVLDKLASLYSSLLDHNMVVNPMTEFFYLINLITACYKDIKKARNQEMKNTTAGNLRKSLNFDNLSSSSLKDENPNLDDSTDLGCSFMENKLDYLNSQNHFIKNYLTTPHNCVYFATQVLDKQREFLECLDRVTLKLLCENSQITAFQIELHKFLKAVYNVKLTEISKVRDVHFKDPNLSSSSVYFQIDTDNRENFTSLMAFTCFRKQRDMFYDIFKKWDGNHDKPGWGFERSLSGAIKTMLSVHTGATNIGHIARLFTSQMLISCLRNNDEGDNNDETTALLKTLKDVNPEKLTQLKERLIAPKLKDGPVPLPSFPGNQEFFRDFILYAFNPVFYACLEDHFIHEILELNDSHVSESDFSTCLSSLRLLGKFLSYLSYLPYRTETMALKNVVESQTALRREKLPSVDLHHCLNKAIAQGKLCLVLPWIVEYLSLVDKATLRNSYFKVLLEKIYEVYRGCSKNNSNPVFVKLLIGWLFELPTFPIDFYYSWQSTYNPEKIKTNLSFTQQENSKSLVDEKVLYACCPFLTEIRVLLTTSNSNNNLSYPSFVRHITPVTSELKKPDPGEQLQIQLEEAFFLGQPASTRKTVDYVAERVASVCVKYICNTLVFEAKKKFLEDTKNTSSVKILAIEASTNVKASCHEVIPGKCRARITQAVDALLAEDYLPEVKDTCISIASRMAMGRVNQWITTHVDSSIFLKEAELATNNSGPKFQERPTITDESSISPTHMLHQTRHAILNTIEVKNKKFKAEDVLTLWDNLYKCLTKRADLVSCAESTILALTVDLVIFLITYKNDLMTPEIKAKILQIWEFLIPRYSTNSPVDRVVCVRNTMIMSHAQDDRVWRNFGLFLNVTLEKKFLTVDVLSNRTIELLRNDWPVSVLINYTNCLTEILKSGRLSMEEIEKVKCLLNWITECSQRRSYNNYKYIC